MNEFILETKKIYTRNKDIFSLSECRSKITDTCNYYIKLSNNVPIVKYFYGKENTF